LGLFISAAQRANHTCKYRDHFITSAFRRDGDEIISLQMSSGCVPPNGGEHGSLHALPILVYTVWRKNNMKTNEK
jgi:hypothetical protein